MESRKTPQPVLVNFSQFLTRQKHRKFLPTGRWGKTTPNFKAWQKVVLVSGNWAAAKSSCNKWGHKGCLAKSAFFALFLPFSLSSGGKRKAPGKSRKRRINGLFPQMSPDLLKPPSLKPPFAALQGKTGFSFRLQFWTKRRGLGYFLGVKKKTHKHIKHVNRN